MKGFREKIFILVCMVGLGIVAVCTFLHINSKMTLYGMVNEVEMPQMNSKDIWNGDYQAQVDEWYKNNFPFRSWFVRTNNQMLYQLGATINDVIIVGKDGWFYSEEYTSTMLTEVSEHNKIRIEEYTDKVRQVKERLEASGKQLVYVITPSKTEVYPENIPYRYGVLLKNRYEIQNNYDYLKESLERNGISYIDMTPILKEKKEEGIPLFHKTGLHWNYYGAALCAEQIVKAVNGETELKISYEEGNEPYGTEQDVYLLANIIKGIKDESYYSVKVECNGANDIKRKKVVEMGTSFSTEIEKMFYSTGAGIWKEFTRYQYFTGRCHSKGEQGIFEAGDFYDSQLEQYIMEADVIIIENNNSYVPDSHYLFVDYILNMPELKGPISEIIDVSQQEVCIDFSKTGNANKYISSGFYDGEEAGRWAKGTCEICLELSEAQDLQIEFVNSRFALNTTVLMNDVVVAEPSANTEGNYKVVIPAGLIKSGSANYITICTEETIYSPKELGLNEDPRKLAHWISKMIIGVEQKGGI